MDVCLACGRQRRELHICSAIDWAMETNRLLREVVDCLQELDKTCERVYDAVVKSI